MFVNSDNVRDLNGVDTTLATGDGERKMTVHVPDRFKGASAFWMMAPTAPFKSPSGT